MKTSRTLSFTVAALITTLQLGAIGVAFSVAPVQTGSEFEQRQTVQTQASLPPLFVVASQSD